MGMTVGGSKGGPVSEPNIVPLIDVLLVLIIIFMVITPKVPAGLPTLIPQPSPPESKSEPQTIVVQVMQGGNLMINQEQSDWNTLGTRLTDIFKERADKVAFVEGANEVPFAEVARAIDIMRGAGIDHVGLITAADNVRRDAL
ncbi:MAG: ExbD/TolR family protein [Candidatus Acidiferrales bacterium]